MDINIRLKNCLFLLATACSAATLLVGPAIAADVPAARKHLFMAGDHTRLLADIYSPASPGKHPIVVLLHQLGKSNSDMMPLVAPLLKEDFIVVNIDMRGHGLSTGRDAKRINYREFGTADWAMLPKDLKVVTENAGTLPGSDGSKVAIVGASIGANAAIIDARADSSVKAVVLLSPGLSFHELKPEQFMKGLGKPSLIIAANDDSYSADSGSKLSKMDKKSALDLIPDGGHGGLMLVNHPELNTQIAKWLRKAIQ